MDLSSYLLGKKNGGTTPTGTININENGITNVSGYATADVNVQPDLETKSVTITENKTTTITPTSGKDGLSSVEVITNVPASAEVQDLEEYKEKIDVMNSSIIANLNNAYDNRPVYTNDAVTLYCPAQYYTNYIIHKRSNGKYRVGWFNSQVLFVPPTSLSSATGYTNQNANSLNIDNSTHKFTSMVISVPYPYARTSQLTKYYSNELDTIEEVIQGMINNTLTYTTTTGALGIEPDSPYIFPYSNIIVFNSTTYANIQCGIISKNETIQVIS